MKVYTRVTTEDFLNIMLAVIIITIQEHIYILHHNIIILYTYFNSQTSMSVKTQVTTLHVMNMPTALTLRVVMSVPAILDSLEMDSNVQV